VSSGPLVERPCLTEDELIAHGREAAAILTLDEPLTARVIASLQRCRVISRFGIGVDRVDLEAQLRRASSSRTSPTTASTRPPTALAPCSRSSGGFGLDAAVREGIWDTAAVAGRVRRLRGRRAGVIGFGRLGARFARKAAALGLEVTCTTRS
jgi:D-3-phosphoglycerate dehydrogenase